MEDSNFKNLFTLPLPPKATCFSANHSGGVRVTLVKQANNKVQQWQQVHDGSQGWGETGVLLERKEPGGNPRKTGYTWVTITVITLFWSIIMWSQTLWNGGKAGNGEFDSKNPLHTEGVVSLLIRNYVTQSRLNKLGIKCRVFFENEFKPLFIVVLSRFFCGKTPRFVALDDFSSSIRTKNLSEKNQRSAGYNR